MPMFGSQILEVAIGLILVYLVLSLLCTPASWFRDVAASFKRENCKWGGDWAMKDLPHFQWERCKPSPSHQARQIHAVDGIEGVWKAVGAI
jgi:hypothetical protein